MSEPRARVRREVVSYVRRSARMNAGQAKAWEAHATTYLVPVPAGELSTSIAEDARVDWSGEFGRRAPLVVEIGPGRGETLASLAAARLDANIVAFEVFQPAVGSTMSRLAREKLDNVRLVVADGAQGLQHLFASGELSELWTFFPDPWRKARHHKRRLINPLLAAVAADRLSVGGLWRLATDDAPYADRMREVLDAELRLVNLHDGWAPRWPERPPTKFEQRGAEAGRPIRDLTYRRLAP